MNTDNVKLNDGIIEVLRQLQDKGNTPLHSTSLKKISRYLIKVSHELSDQNYRVILEHLQTINIIIEDLEVIES